jgi:hypothetical protein
MAIHLLISDDDQPGQSDSQFVYVTDDALHKREASQGRALHAQFMVVGQQSLRLKIRHTMAESGAVAAGAPSVAVLDRVCGVKGRLATLCTHEAELDVELSELDVQHAIKLRELEAARLTLEAVHKEAVERVKAKRDVVRAETNAAECELDAAVNAPLSGGRDPTEWLPDELMLMVLERVPFATLWSGACERVCHEVGAADGERLDRAPQARRAVGGVRGGCDQAAHARGSHEHCVGARRWGRRQNLLWSGRQDHQGLVGREWRASADVDSAH